MKSAATKDILLIYKEFSIGATLLYYDYQCALIRFDESGNENIHNNPITLITPRAKDLKQTNVK